MNVPSGYTALDLIGFTDRGDYDAQENYVKNDLVHYNGRVWLCLVDDTTEITPVAGANWKVWIDEAAYLSGLADVTISNPANGEAIRYNSQSGKWENVSVDSTPTSGSANLVQSGGVATQLANKANTADLATVATTGAYSDLSGTPQLAVVATSGAYSDLTGQPTIPTVNDATLTIQKNGTNVETFTANSSTNKTANITVPDVINDLSDVNISSVANEEILAYDSTSSKWKNSGALGALKETLTNQSKVNGAVNMLPITVTSQVIRGITWTVNPDGTVTATGSVSEGEADSQFVLCYVKDRIPNGRYRLTGCPSGGADNKYYLFINTTGDTTSNKRDTGEGTTFNYINDNSNTVYIRIYPGATTPLVFKPMISIPSMNMQYDDYVPYAKSNKGLTDKLTELSNDVSKKIIRLAHKACITIKATKSDRVQCKIISGAGECFLNYSGSTWSIFGKVIENRSTTVDWTYSTSGDTIILNCASNFDGILISSESYIEVTQGNSSPQANTIDTLNLYNLVEPTP